MKSSSPNKVSLQGPETPALPRKNDSDALMMGAPQHKLEATPVHSAAPQEWSLPIDSELAELHQAQARTHAAMANYAEAQASLLQNRSKAPMDAVAMLASPRTEFISVIFEAFDTNG